MTTLALGNCTINIVTSRTEAAISPIFQFHCTALMNFISTDQIFCAYPMLTLQSLVIINPDPLYQGIFNWSNLNALLKYISHGI
ncbi:hypothetical protein J3A83DRAFT_4089352 [Scleroderma citrinum]